MGWVWEEPEEPENPLQAKVDRALEAFRVVKGRLVEAKSETSRARVEAGNANREALRQRELLRRAERSRGELKAGLGAMTARLRAQERDLARLSLSRRRLIRRQRAALAEARRPIARPVWDGTPHAEPSRLGPRRIA